MCGIAGAIAPDRDAIIEGMTEALVHRGPDDSGTFRDDRIALGQRRLSIIDLAGGRQPIANEDGTLQLVCNGEIYNSPELRRGLIARGHRMRTATDVEVILHLYEEHGRNCVRHLRGMFAFALWDSRRGSLLLARDHLGQKPLFYHHDGETFLFASEVKAILAVPRVRRRIDLDALWHYVRLRFVPDRRTLFAGIAKLPAATTLVLEDGKVTTERYWQPSFTAKLAGGEEEITRDLEALLDETVAMHLLSDVRVGAFLSGGIDSGLVSAMMARHTAGAVPSFSIGVAEQSYNELPFARMVAERYGMEGHEKVVNADLIRLVPTMVGHLDEPADPFGVGVFLVAREASRVVKVVLGGDGGDENFAGYDRFAGQRLADVYCALPAWFRSQVMARAIDLVPESFAYKSLAQKLKWINRMSFFGKGERYAESLGFLRFGAGDQERLFTSAARGEIADADSLAKILVHFEADNAADLVDRMLFTDLMTRIPDHLLVLVDRMTMAHSIECRSPLLDHVLVEFAASIPADLKLRGRTLKYILRKIAERHLPAELVHRPKQGFGFPLGAWMRSDLRVFLENLVADSALVAAGLFEPTYLADLATRHIAGRADHSFRLWIFINLEIWYRLNFAGATPDTLNETIARLSRPRPGGLARPSPAAA
jgi:asparagine synthase (glutamine-hydrolysing)